MLEVKVGNIYVEFLESDSKPVHTPINLVLVQV